MEISLVSAKVLKIKGKKATFLVNPTEKLSEIYADFSKKRKGNNSNLRMFHESYFTPLHAFAASFDLGYTSRTPLLFDLRRITVTAIRAFDEILFNNKQLPDSLEGDAEAIQTAITEIKKSMALL